MLGIAIVILVITLLISGIHLYLWRRLVRDPLPAGRWRRAGGIALVVLAVLIPATLVGGRALPLRLQSVLVWPGYLWLALMFYLLVALVVLEPVRLALRGWVRRAPRVAAEPESELVAAEVGGRSGAPETAPEPPAELPAPTSPAPLAAGFDPSRRLVLARSAALIAGAAAATATGLGTWTALSAPGVKRVPVRLPKLPASMDGFRIALVSDIHIGPLLGRAHTERIVRIINSLDADLVAVVGDLVDGSVAELGAAAEPLADLRARRGSFFVTGNHEYFSGHEEWIDEIDSLGLRVLRNERVEIDGLDLAGVNDLTGESYADGPDIAGALNGRDTTRPAVLLAHQPVQVHEAARHGVDLQLSGHTHGGQLVPFNLLVKLQQPVVAGLATVDGTQVYVTRGAGFWGPPVRFGAPPDISLIQLRQR